MTVEGLKTVFDWIAVILLFLTFASGVVVLITGNIINNRQAEQLRQFNMDLAGAKKEVAEANAKAEGFRLEIAKANESAAKAEQRAAEANLELARLKAPRSLTDKQAEQIAESLKSFRGQEFEIATIMGGDEPTAIANRIGRILGDPAGWKPMEQQGYRPVYGTEGVSVAYNPNANPRTRDAAAALVTALTSHGIRAKVVPPDSSTPPDRVRVEVSDEPIKVSRPSPR